MFQGLMAQMMAGGNGGNGPGGSMIMNMLLPIIQKPETINMLTEKVKEMFSHLADKFQCGITDVSISVQLVATPVTTGQKDAEGKDLVELDENGKPKANERFLILFFVQKDGKRTAVQKAWADEYIQDVLNEMQNKQ